MLTRELGRSGLHCSQVALGTWPLAGSTGILGYAGIDETVAHDIVTTAIASGVTLFDTANVYGDGLAERLLGKLLAPSHLVCTKGGWDVERGRFNSDPAFIEEAFLRSRERLSRQVVDIYLLHNPPGHLIGVADLYRPLLSLRSRGLVRLIGVSVATPRDAWLTLDVDHVDVVQLPYNFALSEADQGFLQRAHAQGRAVLVREALGNGLLTGKYRSVSQFSRDDFRSRWPADLVTTAAAALAEWQPFRRAGESWVEFALRFVLDRPEVSAVVVGARTVEQIIESIRAGSTRCGPYAVATQFSSEVSTPS